MSMNGLGRIGGKGRRGQGPSGENLRNSRTTFPQLKARQDSAAIRQAVADLRTPQEQLKRLDQAFGVGQGAAKERAKLQARIEALAKAAATPRVGPKKSGKKDGVKQTGVGVDTAV